MDRDHPHKKWELGEAGALLGSAGLCWALLGSAGLEHIKSILTTVQMACGQWQHASEGARVSLAVTAGFVSCSLISGSSEVGDPQELVRLSLFASKENKFPRIMELA